MCTSIASYLIKGLKNTKKIWEETKEQKDDDILCKSFNDGDLKDLDISKKITALLCSLDTETLRWNFPWMKANTFEIYTGSIC